MKQMRLRFVTSDDTLISRGIQFAEYGFWASHVEAVMPEGTLLGAHAGGGVMNRPADYDAKDWTREQYVDLMSNDEQDARFQAFLRSQVGKAYDLTAIAAFVARRDWQEDDSWFCSELIAAALVDSGWISSKLGTAVNHVMPRDVLLMLSARSDAHFGPFTDRRTHR